MDPSEAQIVFLDELEKRVSEIPGEVESLREFLKEFIHELAKDLRTAMSENTTQVVEAVNKKEYPKPESIKPIVTALQDVQKSNKGIKRLTKTDINVLAKRMEILIDVTSEMNKKIDELLKPKKWEYEMQRHSLHGHIVGVTATQKENNREE